MGECCDLISRWYTNRFRGLTPKEHAAFWFVGVTLIVLNSIFLSLELNDLRRANANPVASVATTYRSADRCEPHMEREFDVFARFVNGNDSDPLCTSWKNVTCYFGCQNSTFHYIDSSPVGWPIDPSGLQEFLLMGGILDKPIPFGLTGSGHCNLPSVVVSIYPKWSTNFSDPGAARVSILPTSGLMSSVVLQIAVTTNVGGLRSFSLVPAQTGAIRASDIDWGSAPPGTQAGPGASAAPPAQNVSLVALSFGSVSCPVLPGCACLPVLETSFSVNFGWKDVASACFALINISITVLVFIFPYRAIAPHRIITILTDPSTPAPSTDNTSSGGYDMDTRAVASVAAERLYVPPPELTANTTAGRRSVVSSPPTSSGGSVN